MRSITGICVLLLLCSFIHAQKKPLDHSVYDSWQHIGERLISHDGKWVVYTVDPQEGDNELFIQSADASYKKIIPRGYSAVLTEDSRFLICRIKPLYKDIREARIKKKKPEDFPKDSLAIVELGKDAVWKTSKVKSFKTPLKGAGWIAYQLEKPEPAVKGTTKTPDKNVSDSLQRIIDSLKRQLEAMPKKKNKSKDEDGDAFDASNAEGDDIIGADSGTDLVLRKLDNGAEKIFSNVLEFYFSRDGGKLLIDQARNVKDSLSAARVLLYEPATSKEIVISRGGSDFKNFVISDDGKQVAFVAEREPLVKGTPIKDTRKFYKLWHYQDGNDSAHLAVEKYTVGMPVGNTVSEFATLTFSKNGERLLFGTSPIPSVRDTSVAEIDIPKFDLWHYNDDYLQTTQMLPARLRAQVQQSFMAVYEPATRSVTRLGSMDLPQVLPTAEGNGNLFVGITDVGKRIESQWSGTTLKDIYAIDVATGDRKLVKENLYGQPYVSAGGKHIMWYDRKARHYFAWNGDKVVNLTSKIKTPFWNELFDAPDEPNNYGVMGWHEGDSAVYIYDRYDVWKIPMDNPSSAVNITGIGRGSKTRIRYLQTDPDQKFFNSDQTLYYRMVDEKDMSEDIVEAALKDYFSFEKVEGGNFSYNTFLKARNANTVLYSKETYKDPRDLFIKNLVPNDLETETRLSTINPQQSQYLWGSAEIFKWKAYNGKEASGLVFKPDNFDAKKKYPMIVYFYERLSQDLHDYREPAPIRSAVNVPFFVSRGYVVFMPDIEYKIGYPGKSAYDYIVSGSRALAKKGWVDSSRMGLQGHSWGGYQAAQLATMTKLFKAVWAGAPVANMTSAYGGIRWESGLSRQFQYEKTQSRIGGTLWDKLPLYIENSPLFHLDKVTAPMVIMANDADGAVPWYQGIELFTGLRRLGKKTWLLNYNGQGHGLTQRQDMRDYQIRMQQFFDWILKGEAPARWITDGIPAVNKGKDLGLD